MQAVRLLFAVALPAAFYFGSLAACSLTPLDEPVPSGAPATPEVGAVCAVDTQCASHRCSADIVSGSCGVCVDPRKLGERCDGPLQGCNPSAICDQGVCRSTKKTLGEACRLYPKGGDRLECDDELYCAGGIAFEQGTCAVPIPVGEVCSFETWTGTCAAGAYCSAPEGICALPSGNTCNYGSCSGGSFCSDDGTCKPATLALGDPCGLVNGDLVDDECVAGAVCGAYQAPQADDTGMSTVCVALPGQGERCVRDRCAAGLFCADQTAESESANAVITRCEVLRSEGEACTTLGYRHIACVAGLECRGEVCMKPCR